MPPTWPRTEACESAIRNSLPLHLRPTAYSPNPIARTLIRNHLSFRNPAGDKPNTFLNAREK